jgi:hypothetical protein
MYIHMHTHTRTHTQDKQKAFLAGLQPSIPKGIQDEILHVSIHDSAKKFLGV